MVHHSAAHVLHTAAHRVLGPHVWQAGAKKDVHLAHLDVTHYRGLTHEEEKAIEREANAIIRSCHRVAKYVETKDVAEKKHGFSLYQGGVVPGSTVRVVNIGDGVDVEACCGTHVDNTGEIGFLRLVKSNRISDGVLRIVFCAGEAANTFTADQSDILHALQLDWSVEQADIVPTAVRFFSGYKSFQKDVQTLRSDFLTLRLSQAATGAASVTIFRVTEEQPTLYISGATAAAPGLESAKRAAIFVAPTFIYGIGETALIESVGAAIQAACDIPAKKFRVMKGVQAKIGSKKVKVAGAAALQLLGLDAASTEAAFAAARTIPGAVVME
eukprot:gnl/Ergobibamus_cyprinoides/393.p1 GENE.gnl/Ergobibamus_cyprinoides/393~~gnl/Ergobibamus_cyprinoides/393.p1  ORF type:complete len:328 (+),score=150.43 gnl/Ergobibamus_cyprinoides/393:350-1333(+)